MPWRESFEPVRMRRVALLAPREHLRDVLVTTADAGTVELDVAADAAAGTDAARALQLAQGNAAAAPRLSRIPLDLAATAELGRVDLLAGEAQLQERAAAAVPRGLVIGLAGWMPAVAVPDLAQRLAPHGAALVALPTPRGVDPPTLVHTHGGANRSFAPLMDTYATVPYRDIDPTVAAGLAYVLMFGMMFADAGHGVLLVLTGLALRLGWPHRLARFRGIWVFLAGAGVTAVIFGALFGEFFGPTGVLPVVWFEPLADPILLLEVAVGVGAVLLSGAYALGTANRWREGGWRVAVVAPSGFAGVAVFLGVGVVLLGATRDASWLVTGGIVVAVAGLMLTYVGLLAASSGGGAGVAQASVELFDGVIRLGTNVVSFTRLAAFGLAHAALGQIVWQGTTSAWAGGGALYVVAVVAFVVGNALTVTLAGVVAGVQALRLEYYELFSRIFVTEGRAFRPWVVPVGESITGTHPPEGMP